MLRNCCTLFFTPQSSWPGSPGSSLDTQRTRARRKSSLSVLFLAARRVFVLSAHRSLPSFVSFPSVSRSAGTARLSCLGPHHNLWRLRLGPVPSPVPGSSRASLPFPFRSLSFNTQFEILTTPSSLITYRAAISVYSLAPVRTEHEEDADDSCSVGDVGYLFAGSIGREVMGWGFLIFMLFNTGEKQLCVLLSRTEIDPTWTADQASTSSSR